MKLKTLTSIGKLMARQAFDCGLAPVLGGNLIAQTSDDAQEALSGSRRITAAATAKRAFDMFFCAVGLIFLSPVFAIIAIAMKLTDHGPVFYRQTRVGQHGRPFRIWKFRTMVPGADTAGPSVTSEIDRRVTRIGRILRRTKLDELPQLWNVWRGDMS